MTSTTDIVWLQDNLRIADNPLLHFNTPPEQLLCLYVLDQRWLEPALEGDDTPRLGPARLRFLWQSLMELRGELLQRGSDLLVRIGDPASIVLETAKTLSAREVRVAVHSGYEESQHIERVAEHLPSGCQLFCADSGYLISENELPFALNELPPSFSAFRRRIEKHCEFSEPQPAPVTLPPWPDAAPRGFPPLKAVCEESADWQPDQRQGFVFVGGELAARDRFQQYLWRQNGAESYKKTRNGLLGANFSTRFSPWLARGCLSARQVHQEVKAWEAINGSCESSYWIVFELLWRDYFHRAAQLEGAALFGHEKLPPANKAFNAWRNATTGVPFIDAAMLELKYTGWISNRARQNVASFLVKDLNVDWRLGAWWFEHCLIDYDVASNWGNWRYVAGVGRDPREDRYFNVLKQASHYDPKGLYVAYWLPELATLPIGLERQQPWRVAPSRFGVPYVEPSEWQRWLVAKTELQETDE
ncbi:DASH family cryptochrome [Halomonas qaidamensis]|uniref:Cryptochrome DASH n=1 Tax=Halomonas qaidamensis TaxID=2866211 RepID=A0ABY6JLJ2_9GAMM|nr:MULTISPECIES: DASH family cryptochrome [Halomonas]UYV18158.1 DASH family cryptochrome [Halomonas qaidamensis]